MTCYLKNKIIHILRSLNAVEEYQNICNYKIVINYKIEKFTNIKLNSPL